MATLKQGTTLAKKIRKAHPKMSWIDAVKSAHKQLNKSKIGYADYRRKSLKVQTKKAKSIRSQDPLISWRTAIKRTTLSGVKSDGLVLLKEKYGRLATQKAMARTKTEKRKLGKEMTATLRAIKNVNSI